MTENISALIARVREKWERSGYAPWKDDAFAVLDALESLSAPPATDDEREALAKFIRDSAGYNLAVILSEGEADFLAGEFLRFRRPSPVTRKALDKLREWAGREITVEFDEDGDPLLHPEYVSGAMGARRDVQRILSTLSLPEPAEVEWEYGVEDNIAEGGIDEGYSSEERALSMAAYRTSRYVTPGTRAWAVKRRPAGDWVPVKGTEQE